MNLQPEQFLNKYMATGIFVGLDEETLLQYKQEALANMGLAITSYSDSGTSVNKTFGMSAEKRIQELNFALSRLDPLKYGGAHTAVQKNWTYRVDL
jgi:hypothetical protein